MITIKIKTQSIDSDDFDRVNQGSYSVSVYNGQFSNVFENLNGLEHWEMNRRVDAIKEYCENVDEPYEIVYC